MEQVDFSFCAVCVKHFSGIEPFTQHIASEKHRKKCRANGIPESVTSGPVIANSVTVPLPMANVFRCEVCDKNLCGRDQFDQHIGGAPHAKRIRNKNLLKSYSNISLDSNNSTQVSEVTVNQYCKICNVQVCGQLNFNQHINGASHKKKEQMKKLFQPDGDAVTEVKESLNNLSVVTNDDDDEDSTDGAKSVEQLKEELNGVSCCSIDMDPATFMNDV